MTGETKTILGLIVATLVLLIGGILFLSKSETSKPQVTDQSLLVREDSNKISTPSAKLTVVEFGDYQCPACGAAHPIVKQILNDYKDKINFVYRHFAFLGQESSWAAEAAECAGEQGKFWEYHNYLYENQKGENQGTFSKDNLKNIATSLKLDTDKFKACFETGKYTQKVLNDRADGGALGINSTPTFFIDGEKTAGVIPYDQFKQKLDSLLK
jgi:protein-disulfide isomerase